MDQTENNWPEIRRNTKQARMVWGRLGKLLRREGANPRLAEMFYRTVAKLVLLFGLETWVLLSVIERKVEGIHTGFMMHITGKQARRKADRIWVTLRAEVVWEEVGPWLEIYYIWR